MERIRRYVMKSEAIGFFKQILESYEDLAIFSVVDGRKGLIELIYPSHSEAHLIRIIKDMERYGITFEEVCDV